MVLLEIAIEKKNQIFGLLEQEEIRWAALVNPQIAFGAADFLGHGAWRGTHSGGRTALQSPALPSQGVGAFEICL